MTPQAALLKHGGAANGFEIARQLSEQGTFVLIGAAGPTGTVQDESGAFPGNCAGRVRCGTMQARSAAARSQPTGEGSDVNYVLVMKNAQAELVAIGPVSIEYQAARLRDQIEESTDWTEVGIARVLTEAQARSMAGLPAQPAGGALPAGAS